ncbi:hypothetical protein LAZ67_6000455 [Cordylochernes scorpioides]|uniref:Integrase p58-like C-terminal domain-containing protein n=1 Tax=Cordylochernes scorpioides TaxID=51811 RepID=A0ABY6KIL9_9ARAC|nr:hypothetical protein LAZ67_6000455 [Cordylochernes scorpioides]
MKISDVTYEVEAVCEQGRRQKKRDTVHILRMKPYYDPSRQEDSSSHDNHGHDNHGLAVRRPSSGFHPEAMTGVTTIYKYHLGLELGNASHHIDLPTL